MIEMAKDLVCGMDVDPKTSNHVMEYNGGSYYFCSEKCLNEFRKDPDRYLRGGGDSRGGHRGHGGGVGFASRPGEGTTFKVTLP